jgi:hypothetical protein
VKPFGLQAVRRAIWNTHGLDGHYVAIQMTFQPELRELLKNSSIDVDNLNAAGTKYCRRLRGHNLAKRPTSH